MTKTYGIPGAVSASELIYFNNGRGSLRVNFEGGIPDDKNNKPATYTTNNEAIQAIIEKSPKFNKVFFRYNSKGQIINMDDLKNNIEISKTGAPVAKKTASPAKPKTFEEVETLGQATEVLLELGCPAGELGSADAVITAMRVYRVAFPNLKLK